MREHSYGLSNQSFGAWFGDELKALAVGCVLGGLAVAVLFAAVRQLPRTWHVWGALLAMGHYVMNHIYKMLMFLCIVVVLFFWACGARWNGPSRRGANVGESGM